MKHISEVMPSIREKEEKFEPCPLDICDGSGVTSVGEFDDIREVPCPHTVDEGGDDMDDDS